MKTPNTTSPDFSPKSKKKVHYAKKPENELPSQEKIEEKICIARISLLCKFQFLGDMAVRLNIVRDDNISTAATDGKNFYYNLAFIDALKKEEVVFLFGHEVLHNVFEHHFRKEGRNHKLWNVAVDYVVNLILHENKVGELITTVPILYDKKYKGLCAEEVYDLLLKEFGCNSNSTMDELADKILDEHLDDLEKIGKKLSEEEKEAIRSQIKESMLSAAQTAGNIPNEIERVISNITSPKIDWTRELPQDIQSAIKSDYSFIKPNKKFFQYGISLPSLKNEDSIEICVAIDSSGSISNEIIGIFLGKIEEIMSQYNEYTIHLWSFDTKVYNKQTYKSYDGKSIRDYKVIGHGGTDFECNWKFMEEEGIYPKIFIMFTDMEPFGSWGNPTGPQENMIFCAYDTDIIAPFGKTIKIK